MRRLTIVLGFGLAALVVSGVVLAAASAAPAAPSLDWWTVDSGGKTFSQGGDYTLSGTAGQPDAGLLTGGEYTLGGGFWGGGEVVPAPGIEYYLPLVLRDGP